MARQWYIRVTGPTDLSGYTLDGGGTFYNNDGGTSSAKYTFGDQIYLDPILTTNEDEQSVADDENVPIDLADLPPGFEVDPDFFVEIRSLTGQGSPGAGDTSQIVCSDLGVNFTWEWFTSSIVAGTGTFQADIPGWPTGKPFGGSVKYTGLDNATLIALSGAIIQQTNNATDPNTCQANITDFIGAVLRGTFLVNTPSNPSPIINAGQDQTVEPPLPSTVTVAGTFQNAPPMGATVTYLWEFVSGPAGAAAPVISDPDQLVTDITFSEKIIGAYVFKLSSSGDEGYGVPASSDTITIYIPVPRPPKVQSTRQTVTP